jgi:hypothetical protein
MDKPELTEAELAMLTAYATSAGLKLRAATEAGTRCILTAEEAATLTGLLERAAEFGDRLAELGED